MAKVTGTSGLNASDFRDQVEVRENNAKQVEEAINQAIAAALEEIGLVAERFAKEETPVDTGRLRNSITHAIDAGKKEVYIGTNVEYASYVENGTHGRQGAKMLHNAASQHGDYYRSILKKHLGGGASLS